MISRGTRLLKVPYIMRNPYPCVTSLVLALPFGSGFVTIFFRADVQTKACKTGETITKVQSSETNA